jgi:amino acid permease
MSRFVIALLVVLGILALVVGIIYLVETTSSLPSFFPGHTAHGRGYHHIRGYIAIAVGIVLLVLAAVGGRSGRRSH